MNKGINDLEKIKVIRPMFGNHVCDKNKMPVIHKVTEDMIDVEVMEPLGFQNLCIKYNNSNKIILMFNYDKDMMKLWNNPLKYIPVLQTAMAICTPDYSAYKGMNFYEIAHNVYMNRWLGCLWQSYGCFVIPTISWALEDTYDVCFSGIEKGSIVAISTLGCEKYFDVFLAGYNEMMRRLEPSLIIVYGRMHEGMFGRFINYRFTEAFNSNQGFKQLKIDGISPVFEWKRGV